MEKDCIIIGGGPAGMTAGVYLLRAGKSVLILEKESFGGQIAESPRLENFPSIKSISGLDFSNNLFEQVTNLGAEYDVAEVTSIAKADDGFIVSTNYGETHKGKSIIIATGVKHRKLGLEKEDEFIGHGLSYCAVCDGDFFAGKNVVLIGDANSALQYALLLASKCKHVQICTLFDHFFGDKILVDAIKKVSNISYEHNLNAVKFLGDDELTGIEFENTQNHAHKTFECDGAFIAIGQVPANETFKDFVDLEKGFILTNDKMETKTPGIYAAGDCRSKVMRQVVTATNDGAIAGISAANYLNTLD